MPATVCLRLRLRIDTDAVIVDSKRSVECTFENLILCGYVTSQVGSWRWMRMTVKDSNPLTGPDVDPYDSALGRLPSSKRNNFAHYV